MALDVIRKRVYDYRERILFENRNFTVNAFRGKWFGQDRNKRTLFSVFRLSILGLEKLVVKGMYKKSTLTKYNGIALCGLGRILLQNSPILSFLLHRHKSYCKTLSFLKGIKIIALILKRINFIAKV